MAGSTDRRLRHSYPPVEMSSLAKTTGLSEVRMSSCRAYAVAASTKDSSTILFRTRHEKQDKNKTRQPLLLADERTGDA